MKEKITSTEHYQQQWFHPVVNFVFSCWSSLLSALEPWTYLFTSHEVIQPFQRQILSVSVRLCLYGMGAGALYGLLMHVNMRHKDNFKLLWYFENSSDVRRVKDANVYTHTHTNTVCLSCYLWNMSMNINLLDSSLVTWKACLCVCVCVEAQRSGRAVPNYKPQLPEGFPWQTCLSFVSMC